MEVMFLKTLFSRESDGKSATKVDVTRHFSFPNGHFTDLRVRIFPTDKFGFQRVVIISPLSLEGDALPLSVAFERVAATVAAEYALSGKHICWVEHYPANIFTASSTGTPYRLIDWDSEKRGASPTLQSVSHHVVEFLVGETLTDIEEISASPQFQALVELDSVANELGFLAENSDNAEELNQLSSVVRASVSDLMKSI